MLHLVTQSKKGFSIAEILASVVVSLLIAIIFMYILQGQIRLDKRIRQQIAVMEIEQELSQFITNSRVCPCNLSGPGISINSTASPIPDVEIPVLRRNCILSGLNNILFKRDQELQAPSLAIDNIKIENIALIDAVKNSYSGGMVIHFKPQQGYQLWPATASIKFHIDPSSGTPSSRKIKDCGSPPISNIDFCPTGFTLVGTPGAFGNFCISDNAYAPAVSYEETKTYCASLAVPGEGPIRLCDKAHLAMACAQGVMGPNPQWEMYMNAAYSAGDEVQLYLNGGAAGCGTAGRKRALGAFRCCQI